MAIVTTDDTHYKDIAAALRETTGDQRPRQSCDMSAGIYEAHDKAYTSGYTDGQDEGYAEGYQLGVSDGFVWGERETEAACQSRHFSLVVPGSGTDALTFSLPFEPDLLCVMGSEPTVLTRKNNAVMAVLDLRALGLVGGFLLSFDEGTNMKQMMVTSVTSLKRYSRTEDGLVTLTGIDTKTSGVMAAFSPQVHYAVTAVKYTDRTDRQRITDMVRSLTGSGSLTLNRAKVSAAFTEEEWQALMAEKPGWTFAFIG